MTYGSRTKLKIKKKRKKSIYIFSRDSPLPALSPSSLAWSPIKASTPLYYNQRGRRENAAARPDVDHFDPVFFRNIDMVSLLSRRILNWDLFK